MAVVSIKQAARRLGVSRQRVAQFVRAGRLRSRRNPVSGWHEISERDVERFATLPRKSGRSAIAKPRKPAIV